MYARSTALGIVSAVALALPARQAPHFTLETTGAVRLGAAGHEARYGVIADNGSSVLIVSLGATGTGSALQLRMPGASLPAEGRYPVRSTWGDRETGAAIHAFFAAGSPEHPLGWFHGESGTVTITRAENGRVSGRFEIRARGFLTADSSDEERWVTVTGGFDAEGDSTAMTIAQAQ
jgi:hypothetical protein